MENSKYTVLIVCQDNFINIVKNQLPILDNIDEIDKIIILHYNINTYNELGLKDIHQLKYWDIYEKYGYMAKYNAVTDPLVNTNAIMFLDDTVTINKKICKTLFSSWTNEPSLIHGTSFNSIKYNVKQSKYILTDNDEPHIILTDFCIVSRFNVKAAFKYALTIVDLLEDCKPEYSGVDICLSIISACSNKLKHRIHYYYDNKNTNTINFKENIYFDICTIAIKKFFNGNNTLLLDTKTPYSDLLVVIPFFNFANFNKIVENILETVDNLNNQKVNVVVMEAIIKGNISQLYTIKCDVIITETDTVAFHKEGLFNKAFDLYKDYKDIFVLLDADIIFADDSWPDNLIATINAGANVVQPFKICHWTTKEGTIGMSSKSYSCYRAENYIRGMWDNRKISSTKHDYHPGFAWAFSKMFLLKTNGLYPKCFSGSGDIATLHLTEGMTIDKNGWAPLDYLQPELNNFILKGTGKHGVMDGEIYHLYHGTRDNRKYYERHKKIMQEKLDIGPEFFSQELDDHLVKAVNPLVNTIILDYFKSRREDD